MRISYATFLLAFICSSLVSHAQTPKVQYKIDSLLVLAKSEKDTDKLSHYFFTISKDYKDFNKTISLKYAKQAYSNILNSKIDTLKLRVLRRVAIAYFETDDLASAFQFYKKALALERELNDLNGEASSIYNIALLYHACDDPINSQKYLKKASQLIKENNIRDMDLVAVTYQAIATNWYKLDKLDSAEKYYQVSLNTISKNKLTHHLITHYYNSAELQFKKMDYVGCMKYLDLMHEAEVEHNDYWMDGYRLQLSANLNFVAGNFKLAEKNALAAIKLAKQNSYKEASELAYAVLGKVKEKSNQLDSALYYNKLSQVYRDSLKGNAVKNSLQFADTEMEEYESTLLDLKLKDQHKTLVLLAGGLIMLAILLGVAYNFLRREKSLKNNIEIKNKEINGQNLKLLTQTNEMSSLMTEMEKILKEKSSQLNNYAFYNSHRLRAPIARIVGLGKLGKMSPTPEEKLFISSKICEVTEELDAMSKEGQRLLDE